MIENRKTHPFSAPTAYDGWPLAYAPFSPAGLHLLALLEALPEGAHPLVVLPGPSGLALPAGSEALVMPAGDSLAGRLAWEQVRLPRLAARHGATELVLVRPTPPVAASLPAVYWPTGEEAALPGRRPLVERLRQALAAGGLSELRRMVWPADLPLPRTGVKIELQAPRAHPFFYESTPLIDAGKPVSPSYILYSGPQDMRSLRLLLAGWSWAAPSLGDETLLILPHLVPWQQAQVERLLAENDLGASVRSERPDTLAGLAALYRQAAAVVHLGPALPWGDPLAAALASGQALVALEEPLTAARCGPAAYLVPPGNPRALGAALLTLIVEENVNGQLREAARKQVQKWGL